MSERLNLNKIQKVRQKLIPYIRLARIDHWIKHIFILPGIVLAIKLTGELSANNYLVLFVGIASACLLSSANYVINEWLDAGYDRYHPRKTNRPAVAGEVTLSGVGIQYVSLVLIGLCLSLWVSYSFFAVAVIFVVLAILYNGKPFRLKDRAYIDVAIEALNNPVRLMFGWTMVAQNTLAPLSVLIFFWFSGAFLMSAKRLAEYRYMLSIGELDNLYKYRAGLKNYSESSLTICAYVYSFIASFCVAVFLVKYRIEYVLAYPLIALLFSYYFYLTLKDSSIVQTPELLYRDKPLLGIIGSLVIVFVILSYHDIDFVEKLFIDLLVVKLF